MHVAQFGSKTANGFKPVWLAALGDLRAEALPTAQSDFVQSGYVDFGTDAWGALRSPAIMSSMTVRGLALCNRTRTQEEWSRELKKFIGYKDWLIGYRGVSCQCGQCGPSVRVCHNCGTESSVAWFAKRARYKGAAWTGESGVGARAGQSPGEVSLTFDPDTHWTRMLPADWTFGVPEANVVVASDACDAPEVTAAAWPCNLPACQVEPKYRWYRNLPANWIETYCVGYWSAGGWKRAYMDGGRDDTLATGGEATIFVEGDTFPLLRWAFTNFTTLTVTICSPGGFTSSFTIDTVCGEPQYALVDSRYGAEMRYCPLHDDECLNVPATATFAAIAQVGAPLAITSRTTSLVGRLYPGRNVVRFTGTRLPGHIFHYSYDLLPQYV